MDDDKYLYTFLSITLTAVCISYTIIVLCDDSPSVGERTQYEKYLDTCKELKQPPVTLKEFVDGLSS